MPLTENTKADITALLKKHGAMGVNQLSKELDIPLSTLQKYLDKDQNYFKKNHARKWTLPEMSAKEDMSKATENYTNIIDSQILSMQALIDTLMSQFRATITLIEANKPQSPSVAGKVYNEDPVLIDMKEKVDMLPTIIKKNISKIPEEYHDVLRNTDWLKLVVRKGTIYFGEVVSAAIADIILQNSDNLSDDVLKVMEEYQK